MATRCSSFDAKAICPSPRDAEFSPPSGDISESVSIVSSFKQAIAGYRKSNSDPGLPYLDIQVERDFSRTHIPEDHPVVVLASKAAQNLGRKMVTKSTGGGADANIFFEKGIVTGVLGTGMRDMHTVRESIELTKMVQTTELIMEIIALHAKGE